MDRADISFDDVVGYLRTHLWNNEVRARLQQNGINIVASNYYSSIPSLTEIEGSFEYGGGPPPYFLPEIFDAEALRDQLAALVPHTMDFDPPKDGDKAHAKRYFLNNGQFSFSDAFSYYAYIRKLAPKRIVEIGSGFSSLIAVEALARNGHGDLVCIEPFPRPFIRTMAAESALTLLPIPAQDISVEQISDLLSDGDILFIDSTHTVKTGSDCLHIYLRLLPQIRKRVHLHVHDVFLPFGLPKAWLAEKQIFWTEQYLLYALMIGNPRLKLLYGSAYHKAFHPKLLDSLMHGRCMSGGGSVWLDYDGRPTAPVADRPGTTPGPSTAPP